MFMFIKFINLMSGLPSLFIASGIVFCRFFLEKINIEIFKFILLPLIRYSITNNPLFIYYFTYICTVLYLYCLLSLPRAKLSVKLTVPGTNSRQKTKLVLYR